MDDIILRSKDNSDTISGQFQREGGINSDILTVPAFNIVIGLGGIGSHVADILSSCKDCLKLVLFDDDIVELSNLNRTAFTYEHIDNLKVEAMAEIIARRNSRCDVISIPEKFDERLVNKLIAELDDSDANHVFWNRTNLVVDHRRLNIFDCRDDEYNDHDLMRKLCKAYGLRINHIWRPAYNGTSITIDSHPEKHPCWGDPGYTEIPSHSLPARLAALLVVIYASSLHDSTVKEIYDYEQPYTFNIQRILKYMHNGQLLDRIEEDDEEAHGRIMYSIMEHKFNGTEKIKKPEPKNRLKKMMKN